ncbi:MAG: winged helix-turn-helix transcriptional regulator [Spirochaetales bacterium]|nr:winged helix-turn-helix transcriptional regulator [Spirochaetales bacterium]
MNETLTILRALADENRLRILSLLLERELCVCDLTAVLGLKQANASRHLGVLKSAGLIRERQAAQWKYHSADRAALPAFVRSLFLDRLRSSDQCRADLARLKKRPAEGCRTD